MLVSSGFETGTGKVACKGDTLVMEVEYIKRLEAEQKLLTKENQQLLAEFEWLEGEWLREGGAILP